MTGHEQIESMCKELHTLHMNYSKGEKTWEAFNEYFDQFEAVKETLLTQFGSVLNMEQVNQLIYLTQKNLESSRDFSDQATKKFEKHMERYFGNSN